MPIIIRLSNLFFSPISPHPCYISLSRSAFFSLYSCLGQNAFLFLHIKELIYLFHYGVAVHGFGGGCRAFGRRRLKGVLSGIFAAFVCLRAPRLNMGNCCRCRNRENAGWLPLPKPVRPYLPERFCRPFALSVKFPTFSETVPAMFVALATFSAASDKLTLLRRAVGSFTVDRCINCVKNRIALQIQKVYG